MRGLITHFRTTLLLARRSLLGWTMVWIAPLFILASFISINRTLKSAYEKHVPLAMAISLFGAACFSMPAAMVAERERGVWRRYHLTPVPTAGFIAGSALAHLLIALLATAVQFVVAVGVHHELFSTAATPVWLMPTHPVELVAAVLLSGVAFFSAGLVLAMAAGSSASAVGLGLAIYLPMLTIGGMGIPLYKLPTALQHSSCFLPGRWAVDALSAAFFKPGGLSDAGFSLAALTVIAVTGAITAIGLYRWEPDRRLGWRGALWLAFFLGTWVVIGLVAESMHIPAQRF